MRRDRISFHYANYPRVVFVVARNGCVTLTFSVFILQIEFVQSLSIEFCFPIKSLFQVCVRRGIFSRVAYVSCKMCKRISDHDFHIRN